MKWRDPKLWIGGFSAVGVLALSFSSIERTTPGVLTAVHQAVPDLELGQNCNQCHGSWRVSMAEACLACHAPISDQLDSGEGLHGLLGEEQVMVCAQCHSEHHGAGFEMVNVQSFALAGAPKIDPFDHTLLGFTLEGEHLLLDCSECHPHSADVIQAACRWLGHDWGDDRSATTQSRPMATRCLSRLTTGTNVPTSVVSPGQISEQTGRTS